jgi:hypothetical protein
MELAHVAGLKLSFVEKVQSSSLALEEVTHTYFNNVWTPDKHGVWQFSVHI